MSLLSLLHLWQANITQPPPLLVQSQSLREQNFGSAEGKSWADKDALQLAQASTGEDLQSREFRFTGGESLEEVNRRMGIAVRKFVLPRVDALRQNVSKGSEEDKLKKQPHICIVAHGIAIAELLRVFMDLHDSNYPVVNPSDSSTTSLVPWPWEDPKLAYHRVRLENTGFSDIEISVPIESSTSSGLISISTSTTKSPFPSPQPPSNFSENADDSSQAESSTDIQTNQDPSKSLSPQPQLRPAPALNLQSSNLNATPSKSLFVRILSQNNIEHLRGVVAPSTSKIGSKIGKVGGASSVAASILGGGLSSSGTSNSLSSNLPLPQTPSTGTSIGFPSSRSPGAQSSYTASPSSNQNQMNVRTSTTNDGSSNSGLGLGLGLGGTNASNSYQTPTSANSLYSNFPSSLASPGNANKLNLSAQEKEVWQSISLRVLPLFNGEGLESNLEDINLDVSKHVKSTVKRTPGRALDSLSGDLEGLCSVGMLTLTGKLTDSLNSFQERFISGKESSNLNEKEIEQKIDEKLLTRLVELWVMFWSTVLPYLEGCFLPFQTNPDLVSLTSSAKAANAARSASVSTSGLRTEKIDTRKVILTVFRDSMILPIFDRLFNLFANIRQFQPDATFNSKNSNSSASDESTQLYPRLLQMISILSSILSNDQPQNALDSLRRALRIGNNGGIEVNSGGAGLSTSMDGSGKQQSNRNRHGWLPQSAIKHGKGANSTSNPELFASPNMSLSSQSLSQSQATLTNLNFESQSQFTSYYDGNDPNSSGTGGAPNLALRRALSNGSTSGMSYNPNVQTALGISRMGEADENDYLDSLRSPVHSPVRSVTSSVQGTTPSPIPSERQEITSDTEGLERNQYLRTGSFDSSRISSRNSGRTEEEEFHDAVAPAASPSLARERQTNSIATERSTEESEDEDEEEGFFPTPTTNSTSTFSPFPQGSNSNSSNPNLSLSGSSNSIPANSPQPNFNLSTPVRPPRRQSSSPSSPSNSISNQRSPAPHLPPRSPNRSQFPLHSPASLTSNEGASQTTANLSPTTWPHQNTSPNSMQQSSPLSGQVQSNPITTSHPLSQVTRGASNSETSDQSRQNLAAPLHQQDLQASDSYQTDSDPAGDLFPAEENGVDPGVLSIERDKQRARDLEKALTFEGGWDDVQNELEASGKDWRE